MSASHAQIGILRAESLGRVRWAEIPLIAGIVLAVLAFGGTEPASFAIVEILLAAMAIGYLVAQREKICLSTGMLSVPALLIGLVLLQLCPVPASWIRPAVEPGVAGNHTQLQSGTIELFATRTHFLILVTCIICFFSAYIIAQDPRGKRRLVTAIVTLGLAEALYGLVQYLTGWQRIFGYEKKYDLEEATGTYINRNHYAGFLEMVLPLAFALAFYELWKLYHRNAARPSAWKQVAGSSSVHKAVLWLGVTVVITVGLVYSRSRMGILSACIATIFVFALAWTRRMSARVGLFACGAFLALSVSLVAWLGGASVVDRFQSVGQEYSHVDHNRLSIWQDTIRLLRLHPWLGTGLGTFPIAYTAVQTTFLDGFVNHAHNDYLELASDIGIFAAAGMVGCFFWFFARGVRSFYSAATQFDRFIALGCAGGILTILLHSFADFNLYIPANSLVFTSLLGLTMSVQSTSASIKT